MIISIGGNIISEAVASFGLMIQRGFHTTGLILSCRRNFRNCGGSLWNTDCSDHDPWNVGKSGSGKDHEIPLCVPDRTADALHGEHDRCRLTSMNVHGIMVYVLGSLALGISMVFSPAVLQSYTEKICKTDKIAVGHFGGMVYFLAAWLGKIYGENSKSAEDMKFPKKLAFLRDSSITVSVTMILFMWLQHVQVEDLMWNQTYQMERVT